MSENKFWLCFWVVICSSFLLFVTSIQIYETIKNKHINQLVRDGVDPKILPCILYESVARSASCTMLMIEKEKSL